MVSVPTLLLLAMAEVGTALKFGVASHSAPAAASAPASGVSSGWTDWAYSDDGKDHYEATKPAQWEKNFMQDKWEGEPNKLMAVTLTNPETVPNDSNLGTATPGIDLKVKKYNKLDNAYNKDLIVSNDNDLFNFSSARKSDWAIKASLEADTAALKAEAVAIQTSHPHAASETTFQHHSVVTGDHTHILPSHNGNALVADTSNLHYAYGRVGGITTAGFADGDANSTLLAAYWDHGNCGPGIDDQNAHWCGGGTKVPPPCQSRVTVQPAVCGSGSANLQYVLGKGTLDEGVLLGNCRYAFYAQYSCGSM